jgi:hypothetical protein
MRSKRRFQPPFPELIVPTQERGNDKKIAVVPPRVLAVAALAWLGALSPAQAGGPPANYSAFAAAGTQRTLPADGRELLAPGHPLSLEARQGVPSFLWSAAAPPPSPPADQAAAEQLAWRHLHRHAALYRLEQPALAGATLRQMRYRPGRPLIASFSQEIAGIEVFGREMALLMRPDGRLVAISGYLSPHGVPPAGSRFRLSAAAAILAAIQDQRGGGPLAPDSLQLDEARDGYQWHRWRWPAQRPPALAERLRAKPVYYPHPDRLEAAYYLELTGGTEEYAYVVSAENGAILQRSLLTFAEQAKTSPPYRYNVWAGGASPHLPLDGPQGGAWNPSPTGQPEPWQPFALVPQRQVAYACMPNPQENACDPWLSGSQTQGNNALAYADVEAPDGFNDGDYYAETTTRRRFDYPYDANLPADADPAQIKAGIVQAFYTSNFLHDLFYAHGFDEASGNAQQNNYGRGGLGSDPMLVEVQDYGGKNNADMSARADGDSPRMQLYLWQNNDIHFNINSPASLQGEYRASSAVFGAQNFAVSGDVVMVDDGEGITGDGCQPPLKNAEQLAGHIALIDRNDCYFVDKAKYAQQAGAIAAVIADNIEGEIPPTMSGTDPSVTLPVLGVEWSTGNQIKAALAAGQTVNVSLGSDKRLLDSALDNTIVSHEWTHFLSSRLIGDGNGLSNSQGISLSEGWSDFVALLLIVKAEDRHNPLFPRFSGSYAIGAYVADSPAYFGQRRYPYSTDLGKNPLTFKHIEDGVPLPPDVPINPNDQSPSTLDGSHNSEVHNSGEVWAQMLWEAYAALLNDSARLSYAQARQRMLDYLVDSLRMTPSNPTFTEARDALLSVAQASDEQDYQLFWQAFAKRGLGANAVAPPRDDKTHAGVVEDYSVP